MAEDIKKLNRNISQVKKLDQSVTLTQYYQEIRPLLFGTKFVGQITEENVPLDGLYGQIKGGEIVPSGTKIHAYIQGQGKVELGLPEYKKDYFVQDLLEKKKLASNYLFPSDLVRILHNLAKLFAKGDAVGTYNYANLNGYSTIGNDGLDQITNWTRDDKEELSVYGEGQFFEETIEDKHAREIQILLDAIKVAAIEFEEKNKKFDLTDFILKSELVEKLSADVLDKILIEYIEYNEKIVPKLELDKKFREADEKIKKDIADKIKEQDLLVPFFSQKNLDAFEARKIHYPQQNSFLFSIRGTLPGVVESTEYKEFYKTLVEAFLKIHEARLTKEYILPLFEEVEEESRQTAGEATPEAEGETPVPPTVEEGSLISLDQLIAQFAQDVVDSLYTTSVDHFRTTYPLFQKFETEYVSNYVLVLKNLLSDFIRIRLSERFGIIQDNTDAVVTMLTIGGEYRNQDGMFRADIFDTPLYTEISEQLLVEQRYLNDTSFLNDLYQDKVFPVLTDIFTHDELTITTDEIKRILSERLLTRVYDDITIEYLPRLPDLNFNEYKNNILADHQLTIRSAIESSISSLLLSVFPLNDTESQRLGDKFLYKDGAFSQRIIDEPDLWLTEKISTLFNQLKDSTPLYSTIVETIIIPAISQYSGEGAIAKPEEVKTTSTASVPIVTPIVDTVVDSGKSVDSIGTDQIRSLQFEVEWIYRTTINDLFLTHGLTEADIQAISPEFLTKLRTDAIAHISILKDSNPDLFNKLFANHLLKDKTLAEFRQKFSNTNRSLIDSTAKAIQTSDRFSTLTSQQSQNISQSFSDILANRQIKPSQEVFGSYIKEIVGSDSPALNQNIQNTLDALILQYGVNQEFYAQDPETGQVISYSGGSAHDAVWFIDNIPIERLILIFDLPKTGKLSSAEDIKRLRAILTSYVKTKAPELALHIKNVSLQKGLLKISEADAALLLAKNSSSAVTKHLSALTDIREMVKENGTETVAGGLEEKRGSNRKKSIKEQLSTFVPLWEQLTWQEQKIVYEKMGLPLPNVTDKELEKYPFIAEFIFFDITQLGEISKIVERNNLDENEKQKLYEIAAMSEQLAREEEFARFLKDSFKYESSEGDIAELREFLNLGEEGSLVEDVSYNEIYFATDEIIEGNDQYLNEATAYQSTLSKVNRVSDTTIRPSIKKILGIKEKEKKKFAIDKSKKVFNKASGKIVSNILNKAAAAGASLIIPGSGAALLAIRNEKLRNAISAAILTALTAIIAKTAYALGSIGGLIGGVVGGVGGFLISGGAMVIPGIVAGANIGQAIIPKRISDFFSRNETAARAAERQAANQANAFQAEVARNAAQAGTLTAISTASVSALAVSGSVLLGFAATLYTVFIIQSAFLIPVPQEMVSVSFDPITAVGLQNCDDPEAPIPFPANSSFALAAKAHALVTDLRPGFWCYWNWHPKFDGLRGNTASLSNPADASEQPDLFDEVEFKTHPNHCVYAADNPKGCTGSPNGINAYSLYWCTSLVRDTYAENYSFSASGMANQFKTMPGHIFLPVESVTYQDVQPGDVIFTSTKYDPNRIGHVAIVHDVGSNYIRSVDSNAYSRFNNFTVDGSGKIQDTPYLFVRGFGRKL